MPIGRARKRKSRVVAVDDASDAVPKAHVVDAAWDADNASVRIAKEDAVAVALFVNS